MISLPGIGRNRSPQLYPPAENGPQVAVEGIDTSDDRLIVLLHNSGHHAASGQCSFDGSGDSVGSMRPG